MSAAALAALAGAVFVAATIQTVSGFGFALLAVPLMTLAIDTHTAVVVSTLTAGFNTALQAWQERAHCDREVARRLTFASYAGMPFGLLVYKLVDDRTLRLLLGGGVFISIGLLVYGNPQRWFGVGVERGAGFISGVLSTSLSTNGPPLVLVLQARGLAPDQFRGTISAVFAWGNIGGLALFAVTGSITRDGLVASAFCLPALAIGRWVGLPLRRHLHGERFRRFTLVLLFVAATSTVLRAVL